MASAGERADSHYGDTRSRVATKPRRLSETSRLGSLERLPEGDVVPANLLGRGGEIVDERALERTVERLRETRVLLPTFGHPSRTCTARGSQANTPSM